MGRKVVSRSVIGFYVNVLIAFCAAWFLVDIRIRPNALIHPKWNKLTVGELLGKRHTLEGFSCHHQLDRLYRVVPGEITLLTPSATVNISHANEDGSPLSPIETTLFYAAQLWKQQKCKFWISTDVNPYVKKAANVEASLHSFFQRFSDTVDSSIFEDFLVKDRYTLECDVEHVIRKESPEQPFRVLVFISHSDTNKLGKHILRIHKKLAGHRDFFHIWIVRLVDDSRIEDFQVVLENICHTHLCVGPCQKIHEEPYKVVPICRKKMRNRWAGAEPGFLVREGLNVPAVRSSTPAGPFE